MAGRLLLIAIVAIVANTNAVPYHTVSMIPYKTYPSVVPYKQPLMDIDPKETAAIKSRPLQQNGKRVIHSHYTGPPINGSLIQPRAADTTLECKKRMQVARISPGESVQFYSKHYPRDYGKWSKCNWKIKGNTDTTRLFVSCEEFQLQPKNWKGKCPDSLEIDGKKYCGRDSPAYHSDSNEVTMHFKSNRGKFYPGFTCTATAYDSLTPTPGPTGSPMCSCGRINRSTRIVGGIETEVNEFPWMVALARSASSTNAFCGGSIINERWILTAAHCADVMSLSNVVVVGEHQWSSDTESSVTEIVAIEQIVMHPYYNTPSSLNNDVALLKLATPLTFDSDNKVAPICPPDPSDLYENVDAIVTGWGTLSSGGSQPDSLQEVVVPTMPNSECEASYGSSITDTMICAGYPEGGKDSCQGDSGGPMITADGSIYKQIGVVSWGYGCAFEGYPGVYARVNSQLDWIETTISGTSWCNSGTSVTTTEPPIGDCKCGRVNRSTRIVGGEETEVLEYPWQAGLVSYGGSRTWCGGSLINSKWVLSAAHCTQGSAPSEIQVLLGEHTIYSTDGTEQRFDVSTIINHEDYITNPWTNGHDISLLELYIDVDFSSTQIRPICLPTTGDLFAGADATVTGFGRTAYNESQSLVLMEVVIPVVTNSVCESTYGSSNIDDTMICAGSGAGDGACRGDSGGPLITSLGDYYVEIGIVSFGTIYCDALGVYARITALKSWIDTHAMSGSAIVCPP